MAEEKEVKDEKEGMADNTGNIFYKIALNSTRLFVFLYIAVWIVFLCGFSQVKGLISVSGAFTVFAVSVIASTMEELS